ncbi:LPP20 family lipoprotein [Ferrimonas aestuarii]|uniref:Flagellar biosynthesis protein FlgP n=1 Tax=Ferrimonas aestuarii TaxID=2569539 RepID=A0A4U1BS57_9GAMM|nr:LPP20 family lipoprotein [Ferrimonas aestuarii]TKB58206.1 flagellar biosynthesis protein FlgP [Ferrimonas aestuarii]
MRILLLSLSLLLAACQHPTTTNDALALYPELTATGIAPISSQPGETLELREQQAMRAARLEAYRELAEQIYGVHVNSQSEVESLSLNQDKYTSDVKGLVKGAEIIRIYPVGDNYVAELRLDYHKAMLLKQQLVKPSPKKSVYY